VRRRPVVSLPLSSPDGHTLATAASYDNTAGVWVLTDRAHRTRTATVIGHAMSESLDEV
jgi:hypothetical protein